jgi:hypothetical protein
MISVIAVAIVLAAPASEPPDKGVLVVNAGSDVLSLWIDKKPDPICLKLKPNESAPIDLSPDKYAVAAGSCDAAGKVKRGVSNMAGVIEVNGPERWTFDQKRQSGQKAWYLERNVAKQARKKPRVEKQAREEVAPAFQTLPVGHVAKPIRAVQTADGVEITFIGMKQRSKYLLFVAFGTRDNDLTTLANSLTDLIRGGFGDNLSISPPSSTSAVAFRVQKVQLNDILTTVIVPLPSSVKGNGMATAQLFQARGKYFASVSSAVRTTVTIKPR